MACLCSAAIAACAHVSPPAACPVRTAASEGEAVDRGAAPGPDAAELEALVRRHRTPSAPVLAEDGSLALPVDWKALPQAALLWTNDQSRLDAMAIGGGLVVIPARDRLLALEARTGALRWQRSLVRGERQRSAGVAIGCDHVISVERGGIHGLDPLDGSVRWHVAIGTRIHELDFRPPSLAGCDLAVVVESDRAPSADGRAPGDVVLVDVRTGHVARRIECGEHCHATIDGEHAIVTRLDAPAAVVSLRETSDREAGASEISFWTRAIVGDHVVVADTEAVAVVDREGTVRWSRPLARPHAMHPQPILARGGGSIVMLDPVGLARVDVATGAVEWHLPMSRELADALAIETAAADDRRLVLAVRMGAPVLLEVDLANGTPRALRVAPRWPEQIALDGDVLAVRSDDAVVAVDLSLEAPPIRSILTLEDDVERSLRALARPYPEDGQWDPAPWQYPTDDHFAQEWLARIAPLVPDLGGRVRARMRRAPLAEAVALVPALAPGEATDAALLELLARSWGPPTLERASARSAVATSLVGTLPDDLAEALACETMEWLAAGDRRFPGDEAWRIDAAIQAGRDLLERAHAGGGPLHRLRRAILGGREAPARDCVPSEDDLVLEAAMRHSLELAGARHPVQAPDARCVRVETQRGRVVLAPPGDQVPFDRFELSAPEPDEREQSAVIIGERPLRYVTRTTIVGELDAVWRLLVLRRVGGEWRVIADVVLAVS